jgi:hypothetical protein
MFENREERPRDRDGSGEITFWCRERVCSCGGLEEEPAEEKKLGTAKKKFDDAYSARKTKTFVQTPAGSFRALIPKASNPVSTTRIVVQPW